MLFDTHVHFDPAGTLEDEQGVLDRARQAGVSRLLAVGGSPVANRRAVAVARQYPGQARAAVGINRDLAGAAWAKDELAALAAVPEVAAIGEIGLDFHRPGTDREAQLRLFDRLLALARARGLPVCVHSRAAEKETLACLEAHARAWKGPPDQIGVQHCFTGSKAYAGRLLELGFFISFSGILTFRDAGELRPVAAGVPAERLLIETDSPWLAPEPFRGRPNEPANVRRVAEELAAIRRVPVAAIAETTFRNAARLFDWQWRTDPAWTAPPVKA